MLWLPYLPASSLLSPELPAGLFQALSSPGNSESPLQPPPVCRWFYFTALSTMNILYPCVVNGCLSMGVLAPRGQQFYPSFPLCCRNADSWKMLIRQVSGVSECRGITWLFPHIFSLGSPSRACLGLFLVTVVPEPDLPGTVSTPPAVLFHSGHYWIRSLEGHWGAATKWHCLKPLRLPII